MLCLVEIAAATFSFQIGPSKFSACQQPLVWASAASLDSILILSIVVGSGFGHFALAVPDVYELVDKVKKNGKRAYLWLVLCNRTWQHPPWSSPKCHLYLFGPIAICS